MSQMYNALEGLSFRELTHEETNVVAGGGSVLLDLEQGVNNTLVAVENGVNSVLQDLLG
jgi:hypothetical protein